MTNAGQQGSEPFIGPRMDARQLARVGDRIRDLRAAVSLRKVASQTGLSPATISQIEHGKHEPRLGTLLALQAALGAGSLDELIGEMPSALVWNLSSDTAARSQPSEDHPTS